MSVKVLIAAGGTGGHILPAIAVGSVLADRGVKVDYLCGKRSVELQLYAHHGIQPIVVPARPLGFGILGKSAGAVTALHNIVKIGKLIRTHSYNVVVGMGGYVAGPALVAALLLRRPTLIHEANSVIGKTNRLIAPFVDAVALNFDECVKSGTLRRKSVVVGMPIREWLLHGDPAKGYKTFALDPQKVTLLVVGGSQGAKRLYEILLRTLPLLDTPDCSNVQILWSGGTANYEWLQRELSEQHFSYITVRLLPYIEQMDLALAIADCAIARAGASTIAELLACGIYTLYVPLPIAVYDHQRLNAEAVARVGEGRMVLEADLSPNRAASEVLDLIRVSRQRQKHISAWGELHRNAAQKLADLVMRCNVTMG